MVSVEEEEDSCLEVLSLHHGELIIGDFEEEEEEESMQEESYEEEIEQRKPKVPRLNLGNGLENKYTVKY